MSKLWKNVLVLWAIGMGLGMSGVVLGDATPSWDQKLPSHARFLVLTNWNSEAVLDRETGLVWEQSPSTATSNWFNASAHCIQLSKGGRKGWRLPTIQDLASLIDPTTANPSLPIGHPFTEQSFVYWSASSVANDATFAWIAFFIDGRVDVVDKTFISLRAWCVRGGA